MVEIESIMNCYCILKEIQEDYDNNNKTCTDVAKKSGSNAKIRSTQMI